MEMREKEVQRWWPEQRGWRRDSSVAAQRWWKKKRGSCGGGGSPEQLQRERHCPIKATIGWSNVTGGETRRWQHNDGGRTRGVRMVVSPE